QDDRVRGAPHHRSVEPAADRVREAARGGLPGRADAAFLARARAGAARHLELPRALQGIQVGPADRQPVAAAAVHRRLSAAALAVTHAAAPPAPRPYSAPSTMRMSRTAASWPSAASALA